MDLKEFTKQALVQITEAVTEANDSISQLGAFVVSSNANNITNRMWATDNAGNAHASIDVEFDIAVTAANEEGSKNGMIAVVSFLNLGSSSEDKTVHQEISRIKFTLPLALPNEPLTKREMIEQ